MAIAHRRLTAMNVTAGFLWGSDDASVTTDFPLHVRANASHIAAAAMTMAAELMPARMAHSTLCQSDAPALWNISTRQLANESDPVDGRRWFADGEWFMPFASEEFGLRIPAEVDLYGITVSLPEHQCRDGDRMLFTYHPPGLVTNYTSNCSAVMSGRASGLAYRLVLSTAQFRQAAGASGADPYHYRSLLHFSYLLWTSTLDGTSQALDADSRHAYTVLAPVGGANWDDAYDLCAALGPNWRLPVIESRHESRLLDFAVTPRRDYLLGLVAGNWTHTTPMVFQRWAPGQPENAADDCAIATAAGWNDVHCDMHRVPEVMCEYTATEYAFAGAAAWLFNYSTVTPFRQLEGPFTLADLPDTNGTALEAVEVYGATVQQPSVMCYPMQIDTFFPSASSDRVALRKSERCAMMFVGPALLSEYNAVVAGIVFRTLDRPRVNSSFGYVYWSTPLIRDLVLDVNLHGHSHTVFGPVVHPMDRTVDAWSPSAVCALVPGGFALAEPRERTAVDELRVLGGDYAALDVAARRYSAAGWFEWASDNATLPPYPTTWHSSPSVGAYCVHVTEAEYGATHCNVPSTAALCEASPATYNYSGFVFNVTIPPAPPLPTDTHSASPTVEPPRTPSQSVSDELPTPVPPTDAPLTAKPIPPTDAPNVTDVVTRPPETPAPTVIVGVALAVDVEEPLKRVNMGQMRRVTVTMVNNNDTIASAVVRVNATFGAFVALAPGCRTIVYDVVPEFGHGHSVECSLGSVPAGATRTVSFVMLTALNVTTDAPITSVTAAVEPHSMGTWVPATPVSLANVDFSRSYTLRSAEPPLNDIDFNRSVTLTGDNLDMLPDRLMLGPYVVLINVTDATTAIATLAPMASGLDMAQSCEGLSDEVLNLMLSRANSDGMDALFAEMTIEHSGADLDMMRLACATTGGGLHPAKFTLGHGVHHAPNITGLVPRFHDPELGSPADAHEAGGARPLHLTIPDHGPMYADEFLAPIIVAASPHVSIAPVARHNTTRIIRRQTTTLVHSFSSLVELAPVMRGSVTTEVTIELPQFLQRWTTTLTVPVVLPRIENVWFLSDDYSLSVGVGLLNGTRLHQPKLTLTAFDSLVPVTMTPQSGSCSWSYAELTVSCNSTEVVVRTNNASGSVLFDSRVLVPRYYNGDVNITVTATAINAPPEVFIVTVTPHPIDETTNFTRAPIRVATASPRGTPEPGIAALSTRSIFAPQPSGGLHFVIITLIVWACLMVLRMLYYVWRRRQNYPVADPAEVTQLQSLITHHVWLSMIFPCTYHCGHKHITLAVCSLLGMYAVCSSFIAMGAADLVSDFRAQILVGVFAAFMQAGLRPLLNAMFFMFTIFDATELAMMEKVVEFEFDEQDYVEDIEMLAPKHFEDEDLVVMELDDDDAAGDIEIADMTLDEVLEKNTSGPVAMGGSIGRAHLDTALDGIDTAMPIDDDEIILEKGFDDDDLGMVDEEDIEMELEMVESGSEEFNATARSDAPASALAGTTASATLSGTKRGKTLYNLDRELVDLDELNGSGDVMSTTETSFDDDEGTYDDDVIVTRYLHNYTRYGFAVCFLFMAITSLLTILNTSGWRKAYLDAFWWCMISGAVSSFFIIEPLYMLAIYLYRWILGDDDDDLTTDMHPFDGEERFRDDV